MTRPEPSRLLVALALVPFVLDALQARRPVPPAPVLPDAIAGAPGWDVPLTANERSLLGRVPVTKRAYAPGGRRLVVLAVDATVDRHVVHDPTYCLTGKGWRVVRDETLAVPGGRVRLFRAEDPRGTAVRRLVSCYQDGPRRYTSRWRHLLDFAVARWCPGAPASLRHVIIASFDRDGPDEAWIAATALPALDPPTPAPR